MRAAISAFQNSRDLPENGLVDAETWRLLNSDSAAALQPYVVVKEDVAGPFARIPRRMAAKAKLVRSSFESPIETLAEKFHCAPSLLKALNPQKGFDLAGEVLVVPNVATVSLPVAASVIVNGTENGVSVVDPAGKVIARFPASIGSQHDPLPVGTWKVLGVKRDPFFHYNPRLFWDADDSDPKSKIPPGPNNPVGVVWISLSKAHYGIHGTPEPSQIGYTQSHGCIRLTNWDAERLASAVKPGTPAILEK
jgi:lipoprotein-anchoring transpeptidase ErfK/SrfK